MAVGGCATSDPVLAVDPRLRSAEFVLLGEIHDNAEQHRQRAALLAALLTDKRPTCVVFEQMDRGRDAEIDAAGRDAEAVATAGRLDRAAWAWPLHRPLLAAALDGGATVRGGNLSRDDARGVVRGGASSVAEAPSALLAASAWSAGDQTRMEREIDEGHCGALPAAMWPRMALAERARDATLAAAMLAANHDRERVVLIAGNGHVRRDLGVPRYLVAAGVPAERIVAIGYLEGPAPDMAFDATRITPAAPRGDPCEAFTKR